MIRHVTGPTRTRTKSKKTSSLVCAVGVCLAFMLAAVVFLFVDPTAGSSSGLIIASPDTNAARMQLREPNPVHNQPGVEPLAEHHHDVAVTPPARKKIGFAITITKDGKFQDGAAVMAYSILEAFKHDDIDISFVAFVHPEVSTSRPFLQRVGYRVIEAPTPVNVSAIRGKWLRDHINDKAGCCGAAELIKLYSYRLMEYDWVVHLDADVLILNSFNELFDLKKSLIYTTDPNMASYKGEDKMPVQGGFLVIKPSLEDYQKVIDIVMEGDYRGSAAWGGTRIGWFWGGKTIQGVLAYYYTNQTAASRSLRVDRCIYNTMADTEKCAATNISHVKSAHFTVCQKPWNCLQGFHNSLCMELHQRWHQVRKEAEAFYGITTAAASCVRQKSGAMKYSPLDLSRAVVPARPHLEIPPPGFSRMDPLPGAGFVEIDNHRAGVSK